MSRAGQGMVHDAESFEAFYERTHGGLWRYLRRVGGDPSLADDLVQESYLRFLRQTRLPQDSRQQTAYLYTIASNLLHDRWRKSQRQQERNRFELAQPREIPETTGLGRDLNVAFDELSQRDRALLWLAYVEGYDHREIATVLGLASASIRVLLFRARKRAAQILRQNGLGPEAMETTS